jgi:hypothetical protein
VPETTLDALRASATPALRAWLDAHAAPVDALAHRWRVVYDAIHGRAALHAPLGVSGWKDPADGWRVLAAHAGIDADLLRSALLVPLALTMRGRGADALPDDMLIVAATRVMGMISTRDRAATTEWLHAGNKTSRRVFTRLTGYATPDAWFGATGYDLDAERRATEAARAATVAREREAAKTARASARSAKADAKLDSRVRVKFDGREHTLSIRQMIDTLVQRGYRTLEPRRDGIVTVYWLMNDDGHAYSLGGVIERDYALDQIEAATGTRPTVRALLPITTYTQSLRGWAMPKSIPDLLADTLRAGRGAYRFTQGKQSEERKADAIERLDRWAQEYEASGARVVELAVVTYDRQNGKTYLPVIVVEPAA